VSCSEVSRELHRQYLKQQIQALLPPPSPAFKPQEPPNQRSNSASNLRRKSGSTKDSNGSLHSSRSAKGISARSTREREDPLPSSSGSKTRLNEIKEQIAEEEASEEESTAAVERVPPLDPKIISLQSEIENLNSSHPSLPPLLDTSFDREIYHDPLFPIREREFVELIIRIVAEVTCRKPGGLSSGGLFDSVYRNFAEVVSDDFTPPPLTHSLLLFPPSSACLWFSSFADSWNHSLRRVAPFLSSPWLCIPKACK
jgi:hypothetical protein